MGRRRGFFAELQHQQRLAEQQRRREQVAAVRAQNQADREVQRAQREYDRLQTQLARALAKDREAARRAAAQAHRELRGSEAEAATARLADVYEQIDGILAATLEVDDFVDLDTLRKAAEHPPFDPGDLGTPTPPPLWAQYPPEPVFTPPAAPRGLGKLFSKSKHEQQVLAAHQQWQRTHAHWVHHVRVEVPTRNEHLRLWRAMSESLRYAKLGWSRRDYEQQCEVRESEVAEHNRVLDDLIMRLAANDPSAVDEYIGIVLSNSVYPEAFTAEHDYSFDAELRELTLTVTVPAPDTVPAIKHVKYVAATDEIRETPLAQKDQRQRYNTAVNAVALRTLHEVFEADRNKRIDSISLTVKTRALDTAVGHFADVVLVAVAAGREQFLGLNLANVEAEAALKGLRALTSKNAFALAPIATTKGVRR